MYVPQGAVYIRNNRAKSVASNLGIPFVPVLVGFESNGGNYVPKLDGAIVLQRHEQIMMDAVYFMDAVKDEIAYNKQESVVCARWKKLVLTLLNRQALRNMYGN